VRESASRGQRPNSKEQRTEIREKPAGSRHEKAEERKREKWKKKMREEERRRESKPGARHLSWPCRECVLSCTHQTILDPCRYKRGIGM
jgi:hypothetical protein